LLALQPVSSTIPLTTTTLEHTGEVAQSLVEEGTDTSSTPMPPESSHVVVQGIEECDDNVPDLIDHDDDSTSEYDLDLEIDDEDILDLETPAQPEPASISPQPIVEPVGLRCSARAHKPNPKYAYVARGYEWESDNIGSSYQELARARAIEAMPAIPTTTDALSWEPAPNSIRDILKMPDGTVHQEWLKSVKKELKTLVDAKTFVADNLQDGEISTPVMEIFKVKVKSDGSLDKLKTRLVVRGDLQDRNITEDKWSPTASFKSLKMFLAHASRPKV
jgi:hypothetical protein